MPLNPFPIFGASQGMVTHFIIQILGLSEGGGHSTVLHSSGAGVEEPQVLDFIDHCPLDFFYLLSKQEFELLSARLTNSMKLKRIQEEAE